MSAICVIDTSVFLNLLDVPNRNNERQQVDQAFLEYVELDTTFILPMATIIETGNHIAQNGDGGTRRTTAQRFCDQVSAVQLLAVMHLIRSASFQVRRKCWNG